MPRIRECHDGLFEGAIAERVVAAFHAVHAALGCGHPAAVYRRALALAITRRGLAVGPPGAVLALGDGRRAAGGGVVSRGVLAGGGAGRDGDVVRPDLVVESRVAVQVTVGPCLVPAAETSLLACLEATELELGLLLRFETRPSVCRIVRQDAAVSALPPSSPGPCLGPPRGECPIP